MTDDDKVLMDQFGITSGTKTEFYFQGHTYDRLSDAISYAKIVLAGDTETKERPNK